MLNPYKNYLIWGSFVFFTFLYFGFLGPWLISAKNTAMVLSGIFLFFGIYIPYVIWFWRTYIGPLWRKAIRALEGYERY